MEKWLGIYVVQKGDWIKIINMCFSLIG